MQFLSVFATGQGIFLLGALAALAVLLWDWRVVLGALFVAQVGLAILAINIEHVPAQVMLVQTIVMGLCCLMLASSGIQVRMSRSGRQSGGWFFRLLVLGLLAAALQSLDLTFVLPQFAPAIARLFAWLGLIALVMLSLGDNPLLTSAALLLWCALGQVVAAIYTPAPEVLVILGLVELALALACSYLVLAERLPRASSRAIPSDASFPESDPAADPLAGMSSSTTPPRVPNGLGSVPRNSARAGGSQ